MNQEEALRQLADLFNGKLSNLYIDAVKEYVEHGENILALEMLCDFIGDHGAALSTFEYQEITRLWVLLDLDANDARLTYLRTLVSTMDGVQNRRSESS